MTQEELYRLDALWTQKRWTLAELGERDALSRKFYKSFRRYIDIPSPTNEKY